MMMMMIWQMIKMIYDHKICNNVNNDDGDY